MKKFLSFLTAIVLCVSVVVPASASSVQPNPTVDNSNPLQPVTIYSTKVFSSEGVPTTNMTHRIHNGDNGLLSTEIDSTSGLAHSDYVVLDANGNPIWHPVQNSTNGAKYPDDLWVNGYPLIGAQGLAGAYGQVWTDFTVNYPDYKLIWERTGITDNNVVTATDNSVDRNTAVRNPVNGDFVKFEETFSVQGDIISNATLQAAADNAFFAFVNGHYVGCSSASITRMFMNQTSGWDLWPFNFDSNTTIEDIIYALNNNQDGSGNNDPLQQDLTQWHIFQNPWNVLYNINVPSSYLHQGNDNKLTIYAIDEAYFKAETDGGYSFTHDNHEHDGDISCNPAFLLYGMTVNSQSSGSLNIQKALGAIPYSTGTVTSRGTDFTNNPNWFEFTKLGPDEIALARTADGYTVAIISGTDQAEAYPDGEQNKLNPRVGEMTVRISSANILTVEIEFDEYITANGEMKLNISTTNFNSISKFKTAPGSQPYTGTVAPDKKSGTFSIPLSNITSYNGTNLYIYMHTVLRQNLVRGDADNNTTFYARVTGPSYPNGTIIAFTVNNPYTLSGLTSGNYTVEEVKNAAGDPLDDAFDYIPSYNATDGVYMVPAGGSISATITNNGKDIFISGINQ